VAALSPAVAVAVAVAALEAQQRHAS